MKTTRTIPRGLLAALAVVLSDPARGAGPGEAWPREVHSGGMAIAIQMPQGDRWEDNRVEARAAVSVKRKGEKEPGYGVVFLRSRTTIDTEAGVVTLQGIELVKASFPWEKDGGTEVLGALRQGGLETATVPLRSLTASLPVPAGAASAPAPAARPAPEVLHAKGPAILVLVDGSYVIRPVAGTGVLRVVNTRALLFQDSASSRFYLPVGGTWLVAPAPNARWTVAKKVPAGLDAARKAASEEPGVELFDRPDAAIRGLLGAGKAPAVFVSTRPAVLASSIRSTAKSPEGRVEPPGGLRRGADLIAGPDGNVYRPRAKGGWEKTNGRDWYPVQERVLSPLSVTPALERVRAAREAGAASARHPGRP